MRIICPQCHTIYQLSSVDQDAILVCHRCGAEFGMGEAPDGAQQVDAVTLSDSENEDLFAGMGFDEARQEDRPSTEPDTGTDATSPHTQVTDERETSQVQAEANESMSDRESDDISLADLPDDYLNRSVTSYQDLGRDDRDHLEDRLDDHQDVSPGESDDTSPPIIPSREAWQESKPTEADKPTDMPEPEGLRGPESVYFAEDEPAPPPPRRRARILPWLIVVLIALFGVGLWMNYSAWMNDPWLRSVLINAGIHLEIRDKDWHIDAGSVSAEWIKRDNGDAVLVIHGVVHNLLQTDVTPPRIHFTLFAKDNPRLVILQRNLIITRPPLMASIRQPSYEAPLPDNSPVSALGKRDFVLVLDHLPDNAGNFSLSPKARQ